jgi:hypothetical protein
MKMMSATVLSLALMTGAAWAEDEYQSTMSGNVTIKVVPTPPPGGSAEAEGGETVTLRFVRPTKPAEQDPNNIQARLQNCGKVWNAALKTHAAILARYETDFADYERAKGYGATAPPKPAVFTRATYRQCMYACLGDKASECPKEELPQKKDASKKDASDK